MHVAESGITDRPNYGTMNDIVDGSRDEEGEENGEDSKDPEGTGWLVPWVVFLRV